MTTPPVLLIIFNRPDTVRTALDALATSKPSRVYIAADGPRATHPSDAEKCNQARALVQNLSWPCEVFTLFSNTNLGIDPAVEKAISWFFEHETEGIILEDDCIPHPDFFTFTSEMLERYRDVPHVMMVSGNNFQDGVVRGNASYYFSRYANTWGWATWRRAWQSYDSTLATLPSFIERAAITTLRPYTDEQRYWLRYFRKLHHRIFTAWDAKWLFAIWQKEGVCITPNVNLVRNIGFGSDATHTTDETKNRARSTTSLGIPLRHPATIEIANDADRYLFLKNYRVTFLGLVWHHIRTRFL